MLQGLYYQQPDSTTERSMRVGTSGCPSPAEIQYLLAHTVPTPTPRAAPTRSSTAPAAGK